MIPANSPSTCVTTFTQARIAACNLTLRAGFPPREVSEKSRAVLRDALERTDPVAIACAAPRALRDVGLRGGDRAVSRRRGRRSEMDGREGRCTIRGWVSGGGSRAKRK
eukprot:5798354-Pleurochrysis_carterae.AAC.1